MALSLTDVKKLWGLAAGICSHPECDIDCIELVDPDDPSILGEIAHIIAKSPDGRRGAPAGGEDTYANTILLCGHHHNLIDVAPEGTFPANLLHKWKREHELSIRASLKPLKFADKKDLCGFVARLLIENNATWKLFGPESDIAHCNAISNVAILWMLRKLSHIVPNNQRIVGAVRANKSFFDLEDYRVCAKFFEHAAAFERSANSRVDAAPRFPVDFGNLVEACANE